MREQGFGDRQALRLSASRGEAGTKSVLIQDVHEAIPHRWRPVGERMLAHRLHEGVHAPEDVELLLDLARVRPQHPCHDGRIELVALHTCRDEQLSVTGGELLDLSLDHTAHRFGKLPL